MKRRFTNEFELSMVNGPSVFELLRFDCINERNIFQLEQTVFFQSIFLFNQELVALGSKCKQ